MHGQALAQLGRAPEGSQRKVWVWPPSSHLTPMLWVTVRLEYCRQSVGGLRQFPGLCGNEIDHTIGRLCVWEWARVLRVCLSGFMLDKTKVGKSFSSCFCVPLLCCSHMEIG